MNGTTTSGIAHLPTADADRTMTRRVSIRGSPGRFTHLPGEGTGPNTIRLFLPGSNRRRPCSVPVSPLRPDDDEPAHPVTRDRRLHTVQGIRVPEQGLENPGVLEADLIQVAHPGAVDLRGVESPRPPLSPALNTSQTTS